MVLKSEKKNKMVLSLFCNFSSFHFKFSTFLYLHFPFLFPCLSFPGRSAEISQWEVSAEHSAPCPPPLAVMPLSSTKLHFIQTHYCFWWQFLVLFLVSHTVKPKWVIWLIFMKYESFCLCSDTLWTILCHYTDRMTQILQNESHDSLHLFSTATPHSTLQKIFD